MAICKILGITNIYNEFIGGHNPDDPMAELNDIGKAKVLEYIHLLMVSGEYQRTDHTAIRTVRDLKLFDLSTSINDEDDTVTVLDGYGFDIPCAGIGVPAEDGGTWTVRLVGGDLYVDEAPVACVRMDGNELILEDAG